MIAIKPSNQNSQLFTVFLCRTLYYCKVGIFREIVIFVNCVKRHICEVKNSRLGHDLPISVNDKVIQPFREDFIFTKLRIREVLRKTNLAKISEFSLDLDAV